MEKNIFKEEIIGLLEVIVEQSEKICSNDGRIPQIELDIVLSNIRDLYDNYKSLEKVNNANPVTNVLSRVVPPVDEKPEILIVEEPVIEEKPVELVEISDPVVEIKQEEIKPAQEQIIDTPPTIEEKKEEQVKAEIEEKIEEVTDPATKKSKTKKTPIDLFSSNTSVADKFKNEKKSLNEKMSASHVDNSIATKLQKNPIKDMKAAIGINEKFKFINELFEGSLQKYNEGIAKLNESAGLEESLQYFLFLKNEFSWAEDNEAYQELSDLVNRRYQ